MAQEIDFNSKINVLKEKFNTIKDTRGEIIYIFENLKSKIMKLKSIYSEFMTQKKDTMFIFGLDSFNFQNKLIDEEYNQMVLLYKIISNRVYCDYYRLYTQICTYIAKECEDAKIKQMMLSTKGRYEKYDYIQIHKMYSFDMTTNMFSDIISFILSLIDLSKTHNLELINFEGRGNMGLNIGNFLHTISYKNSILNEQILLFINYCEFFLQLHTKYYTRFITKLKIMFGQINHDIHFDDSSFSNKKNTKNFMKNIQSEISPKDSMTMNALKHSIVSSDDEDDSKTPNGNTSPDTTRPDTITKPVFLSKTKTQLNTDTSEFNNSLLNINETQELANIMDDDTKPGLAKQGMLNILNGLSSPTEDVDNTDLNADASMETNHINMMNDFSVTTVDG
jgi:hypothetical protein